VISLTLDRVDLDARLVEVIEKGDKSRVIPISEVTAEALREWLAARPDRPGNPYVFLSYQGGQLTKYGLYQAVKRIAERAGVVGRSNPHAFRHFFGHKWMETGGGISQLSDMLGHSQIHVTKQFYLRFDIEAIRREHSAHSPLAEWAEKK
jgi:site-specific recombinase XerD